MDRKTTATQRAVAWTALAIGLAAAAAGAWWALRSQEEIVDHHVAPAPLAPAVPDAATDPIKNLPTVTSEEAIRASARFASMYTPSGDYRGPELDGISAGEYAALRAKAEAGDLVAATQLYLTLHECHTILQKTPTAAELVALRYTPEDAEKMLRERSVELEHCSAIPQDAVADRFDWLTKAAEAGFLEAQFIYGVHGEHLLGGIRGMVANPQAIQRYKETKMRYMTTAASQRNLRAMLALSDTYRGGVTTPQDLVAAHGLRIAIRTLYPDVVPQLMVEISADGLSPAQRQAAEEYARQFIRQTKSGS